jgi:hypothetical protein
MDAQKTNQLNPNEYSFHYTLYRGFSIFVVRYIYHYINANNIDDIYEGIKNVTKIMPDFKKIGEIIINDYFKLFGFMIACGENFLNYYGELMPYNEVYYFDYKDYILTDFALIKIFFSINDYQSYFSLLNIYKKSSLEGTYKIMKKHFFSNDITPSEENFLEIEDYYHFMKFNGKILKLILNIIQDNTCFLWVLGRSYQFLTDVKISNELLKNLFIKDKNNIKEITKKLIINEIMSNENLNDYTNINDAIFDSIKGVFGEEKIEELLLSMTNKTLTRNKKAKFSIKDEYLKYLDISSIYNYKEKSSIQKYINNFKKEKISIYNTYFYPFSKYEVNLQNNIFQNFFINQENFDITFKMTELLLKFFSLLFFLDFYIRRIN